jgi:hypothetical protein
LRKSSLPKEPELIHEDKERGHDDVSKMPIVHHDDDVCDDMDWEPTPYVVGEPVALFGSTTEIEIEIEIKFESEAGGMLDGTGSEAMITDDVGMEELPVVLVPALRRSKRLAERRLHQEKLELESKMTAVDVSTCKQVLVPEVLGSTFVDGRRRSSRHLKTNVDVVA